MQNIGVIGAGSWGTALAQAFTRAGRDVLLWGRREDMLENIETRHENSLYLPGITLSKAIKTTTDPEQVVKQSDILFLVIPAQHLRSALSLFKPHMPADMPVVICSKGIELSTGALMSQMVAEELPDNPYLVLSGPTFADEVAKGLPAATTLATPFGAELGRKVAEAIGSKTFRPYVTSDPIGAEIGGAVKNVIAVACGIVQGYGLGENARCAIMTRGMAEIKRMGKVMGAKPETFLGLSGMGDLTLTCSSMKSRNFSLGVMRGEGEALNEILAKRNQVTEGVATASAVLDFAKKHAVDMPICKAVNETLHNGTTIEETIDALMTRPLTQELG